MTEKEIVKILNSKKILRENINKYKEYIIRFYGESERERIEEAFSKTLLIPYFYPSTASIYLDKLQKDITKKVVEEYRKELTTYDIIGGGDLSCLDEFNVCLFQELLKELDKKENKNKKKIDEIFSKLRGLLTKIDRNITANNILEYRNHPLIKELESLYELLPEMLEKFNERMSKYKRYEELVHQSWEIERKIKRKYCREFIKNILFLLPDNIKKEAEEFLNSNAIAPPERIAKILEPSSYTHSPYDDLLSEEAKRQIYEIREEYKRKEQLEIQKNHFICIPYQEEVDKYDTVKPIKLEEEMNDSATANIPNVIRKNGEYKLFCPIVICFDKEEEKIDHNIIHELNHLTEQYLLEADETGYRVISGWDTITVLVDEEQDKIKPSSRKYEYINEAINELITQEICSEMLKDGFKLFDEDPIYNGSGYEQLLFLVKEFYEKYKDIIIESRKEGNIKLIMDYVGEDNFNELAKLVDDCKGFIKRYPTQTEKDNAEREKNIILAKMEEYSRNSKVPNNRTK